MKIRYQELLYSYSLVFFANSLCSAKPFGQYSVCAERNCNDGNARIVSSFGRAREDRTRRYRVVQSIGAGRFIFGRSTRKGTV